MQTKHSLLFGVGQHRAFSKSISFALIFSFILAPWQVFAGDVIFREIENFRYQNYIPDSGAINNTGAYSRSYKIAIPLGRGKTTPDLQLLYSSQDTRQGSSVGYGWSLNIPYIERINKIGVDKLYDQDFDHSFYNSSLSGELIRLGTTTPINGSFLGISRSLQPDSYKKLYFFKQYLETSSTAQVSTSSFLEPLSDLIQTIDPIIANTPASSSINTDTTELIISNNPSSSTPDFSLAPAFDRLDFDTTDIDKGIFDNSEAKEEIVKKDDLFRPNGSLILQKERGFELSGERTEDTQTFFDGYRENGLSEYRTRLYLHPVNFRDPISGLLKPIDTRFSTSSKGFVMTRAPYQASLNTTSFVSSHFLTIKHKGNIFTVDPVNESKNNKRVHANIVDASTTGHTLIYPNLLDQGMDLKITTLDDRLIKEVVMNDPSIVASTTGDTIDIPFQLNFNSGFSVVVDGQELKSGETITSSNLATINSGNDLIAYILPPHAAQIVPMSSSSPLVESIIPIQISYTISGKKLLLTKHIPVKWLRTATFPITTDATFGFMTNTSSLADGVLQRASGTGASWSDLHDGTGTYAYTLDVNNVVPHVATLSNFSSGQWYGIARAILNFDTSSLADTTITTASLKISSFETPIDYFNQSVNITKVTPATTTSLSYSDYDIANYGTTTLTNDFPLSSWPGAGGKITLPFNSAGTSSINKTGITSLSLRLTSDITNTPPTWGNNGGTAWSRAPWIASEGGASTTPYLEVSFVSTEALNLKVEGVSNPLGVATLTPRFSAIFQDTSSTSAVSQYQIQVTSSSTSWASPIWDSGQQNLSSTTLSGSRTPDIYYGGSPIAFDRTKYYWRIKLWTPTGTSTPWSTGGEYFRMQGDVNFSAKVDNGSFIQYTSTSQDTWFAYDKNGTKYSYGATSSSRVQEPDAFLHTYRWMLDSVTDSNGNIASYNYFTDSNQSYISRITYTDSATSTGNTRIDFVYEQRNDIATSSVAGFPVVNKLRLKTIYVYVNNELIHQYSLGYTSGDNGFRSLLASVQESARNVTTGTTTLPALIFSYSTSTNSWTENTDSNKWQFPALVYFAADRGADLGYRVLDANGDGRVDIVSGSVYLNNGNTWVLSGAGLPLVSTAVDEGVRLSDVNGDGITDELHGLKGNPDSNPVPATINNVYLGSTGGWSLSSMKLPSLFSTTFNNGGQSRYPTRVFDANGDGLADVVDDYNKVNTSDGTQWVKDLRWSVPVSFPTAGSSYWSQQTIDVNGDGLLDIIGVSGVYLNTGIGWTSSNWSMPFTFDGDERFADINSDGLIDVVKGNGASIYRNTGSGWTTSGNAPVAAYYNPDPTGHCCLPEDRGVSFDDINGDGLVDAIQNTYHYDGNHNQAPDRHVYLKNGNRPDLLTTVANERGGRTEVSYGNYPLRFPVEVVTAVSSSGGFGGATTTLSYTYGGGEYYQQLTPPVERRFLGFQTVTATDAAGNQTVSYYHQRSGTDSANGEYNDHIAKSGKAYRMEKKDPSGNVFSRTINKWARADYGDGRNFVKLMQSLIQTFDGDSSHRDTAVTSVYDDTNGNTLNQTNYGEVTGNNDGSFSDTGGDFSSTTYSYAASSTNAIMSLVSREQSADQIGNIIKDTKWSFDNLQSGLLSRGNQTKEERLNWPLAAPLISDPTLGTWTFSVNTGHFADSGIVQNHRRINYSDIFSTPEWSKISTTYTGLISGRSYRVHLSILNGLGFPVSSIELIVNGATLSSLSSSGDLDGTFTASGSSATIEVKLSNNSTSGNTTGKYWEAYNLILGIPGSAGSLYASTTKTYDTYGNVLTFTDQRGNISTTTYDLYNLFPATTTNTLGQYQTFTYDYGTGKIATTTDVNGRVFATLYDGLGRPVLEKQPDFTTPITLVTKTSYTYSDTTTTPSYVLRKDYLNSATTSDSYTYLDGLGRILQTKKEAEVSNGWITSDTIYNNIGSVGAQSLPYFTASSSYGTPTVSSYLYTNFTYDPEGRVLTQADVLGTTTNTYNDWKLRVIDPLGNKKDLWKDARGNLATVVEYPAVNTPATTTYTWNLLGKLTKLTDASGNIRNFSYDTLGRLLTSEDLHTVGDTTYGTSSWGYDDANNVISFLNPRFQTVNYSYDKLNRVVSEDYTGTLGTEISYTYDTGTDGKGRLTQSVRQGSATTSLSYNPIGLTAIEAKKIGTAWATTSTTYLRNGAVDTLTYPNNEQVWNIYNDAGNLNQVLAKKPASTTLQKVIELTNYGPNGLPSFQDYGNNTQTTWTYDAMRKYQLIHKVTLSTSTTAGVPENLSL